jgi:hypothetical protein
MKRYLLIFGFAVLMLAGLNLRENTAIVTSVDFPISEQLSFTQHDNSHKAEIARQANSLFAPPSTRTIASGEHNEVNARPQEVATIIFTTQTGSETLSPPTPADSFTIIACNGSFDRASDYYVFALRRIIV